jgi:hypothetical protein
MSTRQFLFATLVVLQGVLAQLLGVAAHEVVVPGRLAVFDLLHYCCNSTTNTTA